jgi:hypothetical protein
VQELVAKDKTSLGLSFSKDQTNVACPWHGYEFDISTGLHQGNPRMRLRPVMIAIVDGDLVITLPEDTRDRIARRRSTAVSSSVGPRWALSFDRTHCESQNTTVRCTSGTHSMNFDFGDDLKLLREQAPQILRRALSLGRCATHSGRPEPYDKARSGKLLPPWAGPAWPSRRNMAAWARGAAVCLGRGMLVLIL